MSCSPPKENPSVVIDNGSHTIKAGYAGDRAPRVTIPTVIARNGDKVLVGDEAKGQSDLSLQYPIVRGTITDWDAMIEIWKYVLNALNADLTKNPIFLTEAVCVSAADREKMTKIMFETFNATKVYIGDQSILSLYAAGRKEGFILSSGHGVTQIVPCYQGFVYRPAASRIDVGGSDLTEQLCKLLAERGEQISSDTACHIKETQCYVALNPDTETPEDKTYKLPDGREIVLKKERIQCPEFFLKTPNLFEMIKGAITKCSEEKGMELNSLYSDIVLSGGNVLFPGMSKRIEKELQAIAPTDVKVSVIPPAGDVNSSFIGGSILTCLVEAMQPLWITKKDYEDNGPAIVHTKCV